MNYLMIKLESGIISEMYPDICAKNEVHLFKIPTKLQRCSFTFVFEEYLTLMLSVLRSQGPAQNRNRFTPCRWSWGGTVTNLAPENQTQTLNDAKPSFYSAKIHTAVTSVAGSLCLQLVVSRHCVNHPKRMKTWGGRCRTGLDSAASPAAVI